LATASSGTSRRFQQFPYEDEQGNQYTGLLDVTTGRVSDAGGNPLPDNIRRGLSPYIGKDPVTGELTFISKARGPRETLKRLRQEGSKGAKFTVKQRKEIRGLQDRVDKMPEYRESMASYSQANRALALIQSKNPISDQGLKTVFPRMFGEKGNLAAAEQERFAGSPELWRKYLGLKSKWFEGTLSDEDRADLMEVATVMAEHDKATIEQVVMGQISDEAYLGEIPFEDLMGAMTSRSPRKFDPVEVSAKGKKRAKSLPHTVVTKIIDGKEVKYKKVKRNGVWGWVPVK